MTLYRFYFQNPDAARAEMRGWIGRVNINVAQTIAQGYLDQWTDNPKTCADRLGGAVYQIIKQI